MLHEVFVPFARPTAVPTKRKVAFALLFAACFLGATIPQASATDANGEGAAPAGAATAASDSLEEVVVTANRRQENSQKVPIAISAVTAESAAQMGITDPQSFAEAIPGLSFNHQSNTSIPFLRGVGTSTGESGDENSVAMYVDDVYIPAGSAQIGNFNSLDRIEVEKGPQGTLFGRNATGGVVQVYTKNPTAEPSVDLTAGYANYNTRSGSLYATGGLIPTLSANVAFYGSDQSQGWGRELTTGLPSFTAWDYGGRVKFLWQPTDQTTALLTADYDFTKMQEGLGFHAQPGTGTLNPLPPYPNGGFPGAPGYYDTRENLDTRSYNRQSGVSLKVTQDLEVARFVSITAWRYTKAVDTLDDDAGPLPLVNVLINTPEHTWTQEFQLLSPSSSKVSWIAGLFYFKDTAGFQPLQFTGESFAPLPFINSYGIETTRSYSGFAQATGELFAATHLTGGLRYTSDHRELNAGADYAGPPEIPASNSPESVTYSKLTFRLVLDHQFTDDIMGYVGFNRGFKSGLFNPVVLPGAKIDPPVQPELLDSYTVGAKSEFLDHKLRVNTEAFYYLYKNIQVDEVQADVTHITNAAKATIKGIDIDVTALPVERVTLASSVEFMQGRYDSFPDGQFFVYNPVTGGNCSFTVVPASSSLPCGGLATPPNFNRATGSWDLKGNTTIQTPSFSLSFSASYKIPTSIGPFGTTLAYSRKGSFFSDADNGRGQVGPPINGDQTKAVDLVNASVSWTSTDSRWGTRLWGKNLTGKEYSAFTLEDGLTTEYSPAPPRTYGITVTAHF